MKKKIKFAALILAAALILSLSACGGKTPDTKYKIVESLYEEQFNIAFRQGDKLCDVVTATLKVLAAEGTMAQISHKWFGEDITILEGDAEAFNNVELDYEPRTFIMGLDKYSPPMSYLDENGEYTGFDVDLAKAVCEKLGWEIAFTSINPDDADIELESGNIDAAWGAMSFSENNTFSVSPAYLENKKVLVVKSDSGIDKANDFKGKILGAKSGTELNKFLAYDEGLYNRFESVRVFVGTDLLFTSLDEGVCDVALTDSLAFEYYYND